MSHVLQAWMEKLVREVQEGVPVARRVKLICEGTTFETWEPIQGAVEPQQWASDAEALIAALQSELPKKRVQLQFIAEDTAGVPIGTHLRTVQGQNVNAQDLGTQNGAKALADALASVAKTTDAVLEAARKMMDFQAQQLEKANDQINEAHNIMIAIQKLELEQGEQENAIGKVMTEQLKEGLPILMALGQHLISNMAKKAPGGVAASVATAAHNAMNGAA